VAQYAFLSTWLVDAPRERAWDLLEDPLDWPRWWKGVERVSLLDEGHDGKVGSRYMITWKSRLPYELEFAFRVDEMEHPRRMTGTAEGELAGRGTWRLYEEDGTCAVTYEWVVQTTERWMNLLAPLARPVFAWNHDVVMRQGGEGLARELGARLVAHG
jgi:uncharacterized protein YndB with AHSA1/START domain